MTSRAALTIIHNILAKEFKRQGKRATKARMTTAIRHFVKTSPRFVAVIERDLRRK